MNSKDSSENPDLKTLYNALNTQLNDESLNLFCMFHFEVVYNNFTQGQGKIRKNLLYIFPPCGLLRGNLMFVLSKYTNMFVGL